MVFEYSAKTDPGRVRTNNEDRVLVDEKSGLYLLADGMGGHNSGEIASRMAVEVISNNFRKLIERQEEADRTQVMVGENNPKLSETANYLVSSIRIANQVIFEASQSYPQNQGMGTTVVAVLAHGSNYVIAWVGDSRVYLVRHNNLQQLTSDHSLVQEQVNKGLIDNSDAEKSDYKNILTRALGSSDSVEVDAVEISAMDDDYLILCSDGLTRMIEDKKILEIVKSSQNTQEISDNLIKMANEAGGRDNVSVISLSKKNDSLWGKFMKSISKIG